MVSRSLTLILRQVLGLLVTTNFICVYSLENCTHSQRPLTTQKGSNSLSLGAW